MTPRLGRSIFLGGCLLIGLGVALGRYGFPSRSTPYGYAAATPKPETTATRPFAWDPSNWSERQRAIDEYLDSTTELIQGNPKTTRQVSGYDWFSIDPVGAVGAERIPVILFRVLPDLAKSYDEKDAEGHFLFGEPAENFAKFGFWPERRGRYESRPLPMGFSWTEPSRSETLSLTVRTCGSCHTGRVRLDEADDDSIRILVGAPNTELLLHDYDTTLSTFLAKHLDESQIQDFQKGIVALVKEKAKDATFFFRNTAPFDAEAEARQVETFLKDLDRVLAKVKAAAGAKLATVKTLEKVAYRTHPNDLHAGPPGFIDSSGLGIAAFVAPFLGKLDAALFPGATKNDIPSVWNQQTRKQWQWDGNIRDVLARNLVAALGLVGAPERMNIQANVFISEFIDGLPPPPYPFPIEVDESVVESGRKIFEENCLACHQHHQKRGDGKPLPVFNDLGTDKNRSRVVTKAGYDLINRVLVSCYQPEGLRFRYGGRIETPNDDIETDSLLVRRDTPETQGYVAGPLDGIWARAPFLHNGSVPTLRHLLVPSLRAGAAQFVRGSISYDRKNVGWVWESSRLADLRKRDRSARIYDTSVDGQSSKGHDQPEWIDDKGQVGVAGTKYRMSWDDPNDPGVEALLAYLKTL